MDAVTTPYGNVAGVAQAVAYLGFSLIRDHAYDIDLPAYWTLAASNVRFDLITDSANPGYEVGALAPLGARIVSFEGANEVDLYPVEAAARLGRVAGALAEQQSLYAAVRAQPGFAATPVLNESVGYPANYARYAAALASSDVANLHAYANTDPPAASFLAALRLEPSNAKPVAITETGYSTMPGDPQSVDELVQAKYTLDALLDAASLGIVSTYLYELVDEGPDPGNTNPQLHYGLFNADFSPKPAAVALHAMTAILQQAPVDTAPIALAPTVSGLPASGNWLAMPGNANAQFIVAWAEPQIWDAGARQEIAAPTSSVLIDLGTTADAVSVYDPLLGTAPIATYAHASQITIGISDHPVIVEATDAAPPVTIPPPTDPTPTHAPTDPAPTPAPTLAPTPAQAPGNAAAPSAATFATLPVYRFFDTANGTHFYSSNAGERDTLRATRPDLAYEGAGFNAADPASGDPAAAPVYRFFSTHDGTHFFTASASERSSLDATRPDLVDEGVGFYEHTVPVAGDAPVYRFFDKVSGTHFYTQSAGERAGILATRADLVDEGIGFYAPS